MRLSTIGLVLLFLLPSVAADSTFSGDSIFPGENRLDLVLSEEGTIKGQSTHDYSSDDWLRTYALDVSWERIGVYQLSRLAGADAFGGQGEVYVAATGTLRIVVNDQGSESVLTCTLDYNATELGAAWVAVLDGTLVAVDGKGILDGDAWTCNDDVDAVHGGADDVATAGFVLGAAEGLESGAFPAALAVILGLVDDEAEWEAEDDKPGYDNELVRTGYVEAEPMLEQQTIAFQRSYAPETSGISHIACPDLTVIDTPSTSASCVVASSARVKFERPSGTALGAGSASEKGAPSLGILQLAAVGALVALAFRRRA